MSKEEIINAYNRVRDCAVAEYEISLKEDSIKQEKIKAHNETILAKDALADVSNLKINRS